MTSPLPEGRADGREQRWHRLVIALRGAVDRLHAQNLALSAATDTHDPHAALAPELVGLLDDWDANGEDDNYSKGQAADDLRAALRRACGCERGILPHARRCPVRLAAPAVPVGVQPEPAEGPTCPATGHPCDLDCPADEAPGLCAAPAVPVVHPEPGDRLREVARILNRRIGAWLPTDLSVTERSGLFLQAAEDLAPVVAAAVAAVRADTRAALDRLLATAPQMAYDNGYIVQAVPKADLLDFRRSLS